MGNSGLAKFRAPLARLAASEDGLAAEHARWALEQLSGFATARRGSKRRPPSAATQPKGRG
jgi:hypothetical protein